MRIYMPDCKQFNGDSVYAAEAAQMKLFLSLSQFVDVRDMQTGIQTILQNYQPHSLVSYHYFKKFDFDKKMPQYFPKIEPILFADSGAFSAATQGAEIKIDEYAKWIKTHEHRFETYANFDVIGDEVQTAKNQEYLEKEYDLKPLPVFHVGADFQILDEMMKRYDYIALGGLVPYSTDRQNLMKYFITCFKMARTNGTKFHGFGMTNWQLMKSFPWHSVDSSSWNRGAMFGQLSLFDLNKGDFDKFRLWDRAGVYKYAKRLRTLGFEPEIFIDKDRYRREYACALDGIAWALSSLWLTIYWKQDISVYFSVGATVQDMAPIIEAIEKVRSKKV